MGGRMNKDLQEKLNSELKSLKRDLDYYNNKLDVTKFKISVIKLALNNNSTISTKHGEIKNEKN
jgi:hypothetical protein